MITRSIRNESIRYILGATGEGRRLLGEYQNTPLSWINYVFIDDDEKVRAWLLSNPVLEDPLDLLIYCHRPNNVSREPRPALRGQNYLVPGAVTNWANEAIGQDQLSGGSFDLEARRLEPRANPGLANEASAPQEGDYSDALLLALSGASWDFSAAGDGREGSVQISLSTSGERRESPPKSIPLALKSSSQLNIQHLAELGRHPAQGHMTQKRGVGSTTKIVMSVSPREFHWLPWLGNFRKARRYGSAVLPSMTRRVTSVSPRDSVGASESLI